MRTSDDLFFLGGGALSTVWGIISFVSFLRLLLANPKAKNHWFAEFAAFATFFLDSQSTQFLRTAGIRMLKPLKPSTFPQSALTYISYSARSQGFSYQRLSVGLLKAQLSFFWLVFPLKMTKTRKFKLVFTREID